MAKRPRFESRRGRPESPYGELRQSSYTGSFQAIYTGMRRPSQNAGWSRGYSVFGNQTSIMKGPY